MRSKVAITSGRSASARAGDATGHGKCAHDAAQSAGRGYAEQTAANIPKRPRDHRGAGGIDGVSEGTQTGHTPGCCVSSLARWSMQKRCSIIRRQTA
jgi:hypothetical protein